jgi:hypothetical protein
MVLGDSAETNEKQLGLKKVFGHKMENASYIKNTYYLAG